MISILTALMLCDYLDPATIVTCVYSSSCIIAKCAVMLVSCVYNTNHYTSLLSLLMCFCSSGRASDGCVCNVIGLNHYYILVHTMNISRRNMT